MKMRERILSSHLISKTVATSFVPSYRLRFERERCTFDKMFFIDGTVFEARLGKLADDGREPFKLAA
ncbi:hypothetical protein [uncultured Gimesia sp.]|uniref:hypothetical protein n=1 Tax=uncultured Gimesia sp. TaxID=1678688 RepID=UPI0026280D8C|nr:hypothetical protein [uncultured Gimesia sp.]